MLKAKVWIFDDKDCRMDKVYENFVMPPSEEWTEGTLFGEITNYKFSFVFSKFEQKGKCSKIIKE